MKNINQVALVALISMSPVFGMHEFTQEEEKALFGSRITEEEKAAVAALFALPCTKSVLLRGPLLGGVSRGSSSMLSIDILMNSEIKEKTPHIDQCRSERLEWADLPSSASTIGVSKTEPQRVLSQDEIERGERIDALLAETRRNTELDALKQQETSKK